MVRLSACQIHLLCPIGLPACHRPKGLCLCLMDLAQGPLSRVASRLVEWLTQLLLTHSLSSLLYLEVRRGWGCCSRAEIAPQHSPLSVFRLRRPSVFRVVFGKTHRGVAPRVRGAVTFARSSWATSNPRVGLATVLVVSLPCLDESFACLLIKTCEEGAPVGLVLSEAELALGLFFVCGDGIYVRRCLVGVL